MVIDCHPWLQIVIIGYVYGYRWIFNVIYGYGLLSFVTYCY